MKVTLEIDQRLLERAKSLDSSKTNQEVIQHALEYYVRYLVRGELLSLKGKGIWEGNLKEMREEEGQ